MLKVMDTEEFRTAQICYLNLDDFFNHPDLKEKDDSLNCIVCKTKYYFHKRISNSSNSTYTGNDHNSISLSPLNQKIGIARGGCTPQSVFSTSRNNQISADVGF